MQPDSRIHPLDYLKCIFIVLMIIFHLVYIGDKYPYAKQIVYTFHMPAFLIISGYLANTRKQFIPFIYSIIWFFIPYAIMETGYVLMSTILPIREKVEDFSLSLLLNKIIVAPMGPYWYLHTLMICYITYYTVSKVSLRINRSSFLILLGVCFWLLSDCFKILSMANAIYFMMGVAVYQSKQSFLSIFQPSIWGLIPLIILCYYPENLNRFTLTGILITYLCISSLLWIYRYIPNNLKNITHFIGCNTLSILLFSPIFTITTKALIPLFSFDSSGLCFMCISVVLVIAGSLSIAWCLDRMNLSYFFCGKNELLIRKGNTCTFQKST